MRTPTCIVCGKPISAPVFGWFCSEACKHASGHHTDPVVVQPPAAPAPGPQDVAEVQLEESSEPWDEGGDQYYDLYADGRGF